MTHIYLSFRRLLGHGLTRATAGLLVLLTSLVHCGGANNSPSDPDQDPEVQSAPITNTKAYPAPTNLTCATGSALSYTSFGGSFLLKYCRSCHSASVTTEQRGGATTGVNFDSALDAQVWRGAILGRLGGDKKMPPAGDIDAQDLKAAKEWLGCGAPSATN